MIKTSLLLLTTVATLGLAATAQADLTWDWSFTGNDASVSSAHISASGTLTTDPLSDGAYVITGISGTYSTFPFHGGWGRRIPSSVWILRMLF